jgi:hypothetical protein
MQENITLRILNKRLPLNCLFGALLLMVVLRTFRLKILPWSFASGRMPHFYVLDSQGKAYHFKRLRDYLPEDSGLRPFFFLGVFKELKSFRNGNGERVSRMV